ncbi:MAG: hypothetical protein ACI8UG_000198 [Gammaproteobacteria bacterium]|jgi:hypothetical protein
MSVILLNSIVAANFVCASIISTELRGSVGDYNRIDPAFITSSVTSIIKSNADDSRLISGLGYTSASIGSVGFRGKTRANSNNSIDNIFITAYDGRILTAPDELPISAEFHARYSARMARGIADESSYFRFGVGFGGAWDFNNFYGDRIYGGGLSGNYSRLLDLPVNQSFSLSWTADMIIKNIEILGSVYFGVGGYSFALGGSPVFVLPDGYTANSADGVIVNNYYVGFDPFTKDTSAVPGPGTLIIVMSGLVLLASRRIF